MILGTTVELEYVKDFDEQGYFSRSYLALDKRLTRLVAVKDINIIHLSSEQDFERHFEEALKLSTAAHPRILPVHYVGLDTSEGGVPIPRIVTTFFKNGSLNAHLSKIYATEKTLSLDWIIRYAHEIIQGMIHLHSLDIVHLDLKASNVFIGDDFKMVLADFGQSRFIVSGIVADLGDLYPAIAPPEAKSKKAVDKVTDIYQFGLLLYSMVEFIRYRNAIDCVYNISTQHLIKIFRNKDVDSLKRRDEFRLNIKAFNDALKAGTYPDRSSYSPIIPLKIKNIISKCLQQNVADRYHDFYEIQADLNAFIFPKGVTDLHQDLNTGMIHFKKYDVPCFIEIVLATGKCDLLAQKNNRRQKKNNKLGILETKVSQEMFELMEEI